MGDFHPSDSGPCLTLEKLAMKKSLIALAVLAASGATLAQSSVSISGGMRVGIKNNDAGTTVAADQSSGNTVNFNIVEDLGGGLKFTGSSQLRYWSEHGQFNNTSGAAMNAAGFHLAAIGVSGGFGHIQAGRIGLDQLWGYNPFGSNGAHLNVSGTGGATENGQIRYTSPTFSGFKAVLASTQKGNTTGAAENGSQVLVSYANGPLSATLVSETVTSGKEYSGIGASYDLGIAKVMFISATDKLAGVKTADGQSFSVTVPMGAITLKAGMMNDKLAVNRDKTAIGIDYALSKRTTLELNTYKTKNEATVTGQNTWAGVRHAF
jgi:hypothetical protein